jgi:hypothetical protein
MSTEAPDYEALVNRIGKVERENRRMKRAGLALVILSATLVLMGQSQATKVVEANGFVLKDASGKVRAQLAFGGQPSKSPDEARLDFFDVSGNVMASLIADSKTQQEWLGLGIDSSGTGSYGKRLVLHANQDGSEAWLSGTELHNEVTTLQSQLSSWGGQVLALQGQAQAGTYQIAASRFTDGTGLSFTQVFRVNTRTGSVCQVVGNSYVRGEAMGTTLPLC